MTQTLRDKNCISFSHIDLTFKFSILSIQLEVPPDTRKLERSHCRGGLDNTMIIPWLEKLKE